MANRFSHEQQMPSLVKSTSVLREFQSLAAFYGEFFHLDYNSGDRTLTGEEKGVVSQDD